MCGGHNRNTSRYPFTCKPERPIRNCSTSHHCGWKETQKLWFSMLTHTQLLDGKLSVTHTECGEKKNWARSFPSLFVCPFLFSLIFPSSAIAQHCFSQYAAAAMGYARSATETWCKHESFKMSCIFFQVVWILLNIFILSSVSKNRETKLKSHC